MNKLRIRIIIAKYNYKHLITRPYSFSFKSIVIDKTIEIYNKNAITKLFIYE